MSDDLQPIVIRVLAEAQSAPLWHAGAPPSWPGSAVGDPTSHLTVPLLALTRAQPRLCGATASQGPQWGRPLVGFVMGHSGLLLMYIRIRK